MTYHSKTAFSDLYNTGPILTKRRRMLLAKSVTNNATSSLKKDVIQAIKEAEESGYSVEYLDALLVGVLLNYNIEKKR